MDDSKENFQQKLRSWFQNKGMINKLVLYLRSQMFMELQNYSNKLKEPSENNSVSPKLQAVKLLIADFLLQENLLFTLSVFCSEVPVLLNLKEYGKYVSQLANLDSDVSVHTKHLKPKFSKHDIQDVLEALGLQLTKEELVVISDMYQSGKFKSLLSCLLYLLPTLLKKNRNFQRLLAKIKRKEKYFKKLIRLEKIKIQKMYALLENTRCIVLKHKTETNQIIQKYNELQRNSSTINEKITDLLKKEIELKNKEDFLSSKEKDFEKVFESKMEEIRKKTTSLSERDDDLQNKFKKFSEDQKNFDHEKEMWLEKTNQIYSTRTYETVKLQEYEQRFRTLQNEVFGILTHCREVQNKRNKETDTVANKEIQCRFDIINQSQQTEANDALNLEEYVNLMEKENTLLKSSSFKQRQHIAQLSTEIVFLKNRLDYLEREMQIKTEYERRKEMNEIAEKLYSPKFSRMEKDLSSSSSRIRKKLFPEKSSSSSSEFTSSNSKEDNSLTDELVAEAKNKLKELETESQALNKNFKNLQTVLSKNIMLNEKSFSNSDSSSVKSSIQFSRAQNLTLQNCDPNLEISPTLRTDTSLFLNKILPQSQTNSPVHEIRASVDKSASFRRMYLKYKHNKRKVQSVDSDEIEDQNINDIISPNLNQEVDTEAKLENGVSDFIGLSPNGKNVNPEEHSSFEVHKEAKILPNSTEVSRNSSIKTEGEISAASKDSRSSSDFWK